jgi:hypothetical protein
MPQSEETGEADTPRIVWKPQTEEKQRGMQIAPTTDELCAMARSREKLNALVITSVVGVTAVLAGALLYNIYRIDQPWIRLGQAWTLGVIVYLCGPAFERGPRRMGTGEPCAHFLEKQHEERRCGYLRIRHRLFLFIPGMVASWWGGGPLAAAKAQGLDPASWLFHFYDGPWLFVITGTALVLAWFAFGKAAEKASRDREEIHRSIGQSNG